MTNVTLDDLLRIIGDKEVTILLLRSEVEKLKAQLEKNGTATSSPTV